MGFFGIVLLVLFVLIAFLLIALVMIQDDQGEGLGGIFGGSSSSTFGSRSGNILTKTTSILGTIFIVCSFALAWINRTPEDGDVISAARQELTTEQEQWWNQPADTGNDETQ